MTDKSKEAAPKRADLRLDPKDHQNIMDLFKQGYDEFQKDPEKVWHEKRAREDATPPFHGFQKPQTLPSKLSGQAAQGEPLAKAGGPYIGPKGGKWADPQHTHHWEPTAPSANAGLEAFAAHHGGKVVPHQSDPSKAVVKVHPDHAKALLDLKATHNLSDPIITGGKYVMLAVPKHLVAKPVQKVHDAPKYGVVSPGAVPAPNPVVYRAAPEWSPHATVDEAQSWAKARGVDVAYTDLGTANETNKALSEQHPAILKHIEFMGTASQLHVWAEKHPEVNQRAMTEAKHTQNLMQLILQGAIAVAHPTTQKPYTKSVVVVADSWGTAAQSAAKHKASTPGFSRCGRLVDTLRHECGHVEGFVFRHLYPNGPEAPSAWEIWKKAAAGALKHARFDVMQQVSEYGATNPHECWAEVSVMRRQGVKLPQWVQVAIQKMKIDEVPWESMMAKSLGGTQ